MWLCFRVVQRLALAMADLNKVIRALPEDIEKAGDTKTAS